jgi:hypothetical protein
MTALSSKRAGYLRQAPSFNDAVGVAPSTAIKSMWRKLAKSGEVIADAAGDHFKRSQAGDDALQEFDDKLSEACRAVLTAIKVKQSGIVSMKGIDTVVAAGLVEIDDDRGPFRLTADGERLADPVGEEGYFVKSGNRVKLISVDSKGEYHVERVDGDSTGKGMSIPRDSFFTKECWAAHVGE